AAAHVGGGAGREAHGPVPPLLRAAFHLRPRPGLPGQRARSVARTGLPGAESARLCRGEETAGAAAGKVVSRRLTGFLKGWRVDRGKPRRSPEAHLDAQKQFRSLASCMVYFGCDSGKPEWQSRLVCFV